MKFKTYLRHKILYLIASNPITRHTIRVLTRKCETCKSSVLEQIMLNTTIGEENRKCNRCKRLYHIFRPSISFFMKKSNINNKLFISFSNINDNYSLPSYIKGINSIFRGVSDFGLKKPIISSAPLSVVLELTKKCNLNCDYCYMKDVEVSSEFTTEQWINIIDKLYDAGVSAVSFSGGEPLVLKDFIKIANHANNIGLSTSVASNGAIIDKEYAKKLFESGIKYVEISILSSNESKNDLYRKKGSFKKSIDAVKNCKDAGLCVALSITMTNLVKDEVEDFLKLGKSLRCDVCTFFNYIPMSNDEDPLILSNDEKEKILKEIIINKEKYEKDFKEIVILQAPEISKLYCNMYGSDCELKQIGFTKFTKSEFLLDYVGGCFAGRFVLAITTSGDILPCPFFRVKLGNILTDNLLEVWGHNKTLNLIRDRNNWKGKCGTCEYKIQCGGCRARPYIQSGDLLESDPTCLA